jgi:hypothetical protein
MKKVLMLIAGLAAFLWLDEARGQTQSQTTARQAGQPDTQGLGLNRKMLRLKGVVDSVSTTQGAGPGILILRTKEGVKHCIRLGPLRFLLHQGFNLTVGDKLEVEAAQVHDLPAVVAVVVKNLTTQKTIQLRDDQLRPLWCCRRGTLF